MKDDDEEHPQISPGYPMLGDFARKRWWKQHESGRTGHRTTLSRRSSPYGRRGVDVTEPPSEQSASSRWRLTARLGQLGREARALALAALSRARSTAKIWIFELVVSVSIVTASLFQILTKPGYYSYADQIWPILPSLPNNESFTPLVITSGRVSPAYFFQFTRDFVTFPYTVVPAFGVSYETEIRVFLFGTFLVLIGFAWVAAAVLLRLLERVTSTKLFGIRREFVKLFFVLAFYCNFVLIQFDADGGQVSDSLIMVSLVLAICLAIENSRRVPWLIGAILSFGLLLDPDYYILCVLGLVTVALVAGVQSRSLLSRLKAVGAGIALSLPTLAFILAGIVLTASPSGSSYSRSIVEALSFSRNMTPLSALLSEGFAWVFVTLGPPSILSSPGPLSLLPSWGSPTVLLLPPGAITWLWVSSSLALPSLCFSSLLVRRARQVALPIVSMGLLGFVLAQYALTPFLFDPIAALSNIPVVGFAIGTTFAIPDHILAIVSTAEVVGATISVFALLKPIDYGPNTTSITRPSSATTPTKPARFSSLARRRKGAFARNLGSTLAIIAVVLVVFTGWQAFSGSYYPGRPLNSVFTGNDVPDVGAFTPFNPPNYTLQAYEYIFHSGSAFNVYWPVGYGVGLNSVDSGLPLVSLPGLPYLLSQDLVSDVTPYLSSHGVRYVVVENLTQPIPQFYLPSASAARNPYLYFFGTGSYSATVQIFAECPGLNESFSRPGIDVFEVSTFVGLGYPSSVLLHSASEAGENASLYGAFSATGLNVSLTDSYGWGSSASIGESSAAVQVLTPSNLSVSYLRSGDLPTAALNTTVNELAPGEILYANSTGIPEPTNWSQNNSRGQYNYEIDGFYFTDWAGSYSVTVTGAGISVFSRDGAAFTLNYGGPATTATNGVDIGNISAPIIAGLDAAIRVSSPLKDSLYAALSAVGSGSQTVWTQTSIPTNSTGPRKISLYQPVTSGFSSFTYRLGGTFDQYLNITSYNLTVAQNPALTDRNAPFGKTLDLTNAVVSMPRSDAVGLALADGNGSINGVTIRSMSLASFTIPVHGTLSIQGAVVVGLLILFNGSNLASYIGHYVAYNGAFSNAVLVDFGGSKFIPPISTDYSTNLYVLPGGGSYRFIVSGSIPALEIGYLLILAFLAVLVFLGLRRRPTPSSAVGQRNR